MTHSADEHNQENVSRQAACISALRCVIRGRSQGAHAPVPVPLLINVGDKSCVVQCLVCNGVDGETGMMWVLSDTDEAGLVAGVNSDPDLSDALCAAYVCAHDREGFTRALHRVAWEHQPADVIARGMDLFLSLDLPKQAAEAARAGLVHFPSDLRFRQASRVLEQPIVRSMPSQQAGGLRTSQAWLRDHAAPYRGQWVVVREGQLLGAAPDLGSLHTLIEHENDPATTIITRVW